MSIATHKDSKVTIADGKLRLNDGFKISKSITIKFWSAKVKTSLKVKTFISYPLFPGT